MVVCDVQAKPNISPNFTFMGQLLDWEKALHHQTVCKCSSSSSTDSSSSCPPLEDEDSETPPSSDSDSSAKPSPAFDQVSPVSS